MITTQCEAVQAKAYWAYVEAKGRKPC